MTDSLTVEAPGKFFEGVVVLRLVSPPFFDDPAKEGRMLCRQWHVMSPGEEVHDANNKGQQHPKRHEDGPRWVALLPQEDACAQVR